MTDNYIKELKQILQTQAITQQQLAQKLGVTFAALNRWLNGHATPRMHRCEQIARLHRQIIGYQTLTQKDTNQIIKASKEFKNKKIWDFINKQSDLQDDLILEHTYNSTTIEGTTFTKKETEAVIFDDLLIKNKSLIEHLDVVNYALVLRKIFNKEISNAMSEETIKTIHRQITHGVREDGGLYSQHQRGIRGVDILLTHPKDIAEEMSRLINAWNNKKQKNIQDIAQFHADFELIHPFGDGNGRVGRLIMVLQCQSLYYAPVIIENTKKAEYYEVLEYAQKNNEYSFVRFLFEEMKRTFSLISKYKIN